MREGRGRSFPVYKGSLGMLLDPGCHLKACDRRPVTPVQSERIVKSLVWSVYIHSDEERTSGSGRVAVVGRLVVVETLRDPE